LLRNSVIISRKIWGPLGMSRRLRVNPREAQIRINITSHETITVSVIGILKPYKFIEKTVFI
jgi:hypothetical protein